MAKDAKAWKGKQAPRKRRTLLHRLRSLDFVLRANEGFKEGRIWSDFPFTRLIG